MTLPFFYTSTAYSSQQELVLDEDTSRHVIQVLRMKKGDQLNLSDGKGNVLTTIIEDDHKKHCLVKVQGTRYKEQEKQGTRNTGFKIGEESLKFPGLYSCALPLVPSKVYLITKGYLL